MLIQVIHNTNGLSLTIDIPEPAGSMLHGTCWSLTNLVETILPGVRDSIATLNHEFYMRWDEKGNARYTYDDEGGIMNHNPGSPATTPASPEETLAAIQDLIYSREVPLAERMKSLRALVGPPSTPAPKRKGGEPKKWSVCFGMVGEVEVKAVDAQAAIKKARGLISEEMTLQLWPHNEGVELVVRPQWGDDWTAEEVIE